MARRPGARSVRVPGERHHLRKPGDGQGDEAGLESGPGGPHDPLDPAGSGWLDPLSPAADHDRIPQPVVGQLDGADLLAHDQGAMAAARASALP